MWQRTFQKEREALAKAKGKKVKVSVAQLCLILFDPMDWSPLGSSVHGFSRQEDCRGLPFPFLGDLSDPGIEHGSPALHSDSLWSEPPGKKIVAPLSPLSNKCGSWEMVTGREEVGVATGRLLGKGVDFKGACTLH